MAFPQTPRDLTVEMFLNNSWVDVTTDVYTRNGIVITRGRRNETSKAEPSSCALTLNNRTGNYSPRNVAGIYYGSIGRNTPIRVAINTVRDTFTRTVSSGLGTTDTGQPWASALTGQLAFGGTVQASDYAVGSGVATMLAPVANALRSGYLASVPYRDVDVAVTVSAPFADVTGADIITGIILRGQGVNDFLRVRVSITAAEAVTVELRTVVAGVSTTLTSATVPGLTYTGAPLRIRTQVEASTLRVKVWAASGAEPFGWLISYTGIDPFRSAGFLGVQGGSGAGNTNVPFSWSFDNLIVSIPRFAGEVAAWPQRWDLSGSDTYVPIEAAGVKRRLGQGSSPVSSTLRRGNISFVPAELAYWPCEEGGDARSIGSGIGGTPMRVDGTVTFASYTGIPASAPLPVLKNGRFWGEVSAYTPTGFAEYRFVANFPSSPELPDKQIIIGCFCTGTAGVWDVKYRLGGQLSLEAHDRPWGQLLLDTGQLNYNLVGDRFLLALQLTQNGSNIDWRLETLEVGATTSQFVTGTVTNRTIGRASAVIVDPFFQMNGLAIGHISANGAITNIFSLSNELNAFRGELAENRVFRLCNQEGLTFTGATAAPPNLLSANLGPQRVATLLELLEECAEADVSTLHESRGTLGINNRKRTSVYNQPVTLDLNYSAGHVAPPFEPVDDDQLTRNDVRVKRVDGIEARATLDIGRMSTLSPDKGGAGRYSDQRTINVARDDQAQDVAGWLVALGTVDEPRYPTVTLNLHSAEAVAAGLETAALTLDVDDRITISNPKAGQSPDQISQIVRGYAEKINVYQHQITYVCAPESPYQVFQAGTAGKGMVNSGSSTLTGGPYSSSATSLSVATSDPAELWVTGSVSIPIKLAGEVMTVTNISGASSPQTFTVTRSVNGVVKGQVNGTPVLLARRATVAL